MNLPVKLLAVVSAVLVVVAGIVVFADVTVAGSETAVDATTGLAYGENVSTDLAGHVYVRVTGDDERARAAVETAIVAELRERGLDPELAESRPAYDDPVLVVWIDGWSVSYRPDHATADVQWGYLYAAAGNTSTLDSLRENNAVHVRETDTVLASGDLHLRDVTDGFVSIPAYRGHVVEAVATNTVERLFADLDRAGLPTHASSAAIAARTLAVAWSPGSGVATRPAVR